MHRKLVRFCVNLSAGIAVVAGLALSARPVAALPANFTFTVNTVADPVGPGCTGSGTCSLRQAINKANGLAPPAIVTIKVPEGHYMLVLGELHTTAHTIQITGAGSASTFVDAAGGSRVFHISTLTTISGLTITGGNAGSGGCSASSNGGGLLSESGLSLNAVVVTGNVATCGGGMYFTGNNRVTLNTVSVTKNAARGATTPYAGGMFVACCPKVIATNLSVDGNIACGTFSNLSANPFAPGNVCVGDGAAGGLYNTGYLSATGGSFTHNVAGSPAAGSGRGGGIYDDNCVHLTNIIVSDNVAGNSGGGIDSECALAATNLTMNNNVAGLRGGGIYNGNYTSVTHLSAQWNRSGGTFYCTGNASSATCNYPSSSVSTGACPGSYLKCTSTNGQGGAVASTSDFTSLTDSTVAHNQAVQLDAGGCAAGGAVYTDHGVALSKTRLISNLACDGAGMYLSGPGALVAVQGSEIFANHATHDGGAVNITSSANAGNLALDSTIVAGNHGDHETGGVWTNSYGEFTSSGSTVIKSNVSPDSCCQNTRNPNS